MLTCTSFLLHKSLQMNVCYIVNDDCKALLNVKMFKTCNLMIEICIR